jgi:hypothetical protein
MKKASLALVLSLLLIAGGCGGWGNGDEQGNGEENGDLTDTTPPVTSSISVSDITSISAVVSWSTDEPATGQVEYGLTSEYGSATEEYAGLVTGHSVALTGLSSGTTYHYRVKSRDGSGNLAMSLDGTFITTADLGYSRTNPAPIGMTLTTQFESLDDTYTAEVTMVQVIRGQEAWNLVYDANMFNDPPPSGYEYVLAKIRFHYISCTPTPDKKFDWYYYDVVSSEGVEIDDPFLVEPEPRLSAVYPGATTEGWLGLQVEIGDPAPVLTFGTDWGGTTSRTWFKLYD